MGKSTLLRTLSRIQPSAGGSIHIDNSPLEQLSRQRLTRRLGIVTTENIAIANMTVRELVALGRHPYTNWLGVLSAEDRDKVEDTITKCHINYIADRHLGDLSDGQRQKAMIARVLAQDTPVVLLAHLDLINRAEIMNLLSEVKQNRGIVISTHELSLAMQFADTLWLMNFNETVKAGSPEDLAISGSIQRCFCEAEFEIDALSGKVKSARLFVI